MNSPQKVEDEPLKPNQILLHYSKEEIEGDCIMLKISPIRFVAWKFTIFVICNVFIFIPWLITFWYPQFKKHFYYDYCSLNECDAFFILNYDEQYSIVEKRAKVFMRDENHSQYYTYFVNRYMPYIINEKGQVKVSMFDYRQRIKSLISRSGNESGLTEAQAHELKNTYGPGTMVIQRPSCAILTINQLLRPLYLFLIFSVSYWCFQQMYYYFAGTLFFVSFVGLSINIYQMLELNKKIFHMAYYQIQLNVLREGQVKNVSSLDVVPGDIVFLRQAIKLPFQGIILQGSALINQCALTGQSVPIVKKADSFDRMKNIATEIDRTAYVYEGTTIVQVNDKKRMNKFEPYRQNYGVPVYVIRTNFVTTKGQLIRIILFPKEQQNVFQRQSAKFLFFLFGLAVITFIVLVILIHQYVQSKDLFLKFIDLITITVPPSLPVSMTFGIIYAVERLESKGIFCIAQNKVIQGGMIQLCCFDKTGTLTEDFMDFYCLVPAANGQFKPHIINSPEKIEETIANSAKLDYIIPIYNNMASNHSIIKLEATDELVGDPMEIKVFQFGKFTLDQSHPDPEVVFCFKSMRGHGGEIYRRFQFDSDLQRMSVVCKNTMSKSCEVYAKGSPQMMATIMKPDSIPKNYPEMLRQYASSGFRVLAIAHKTISDSNMKTISRADAESQLIFDGFEVFENKLKKQTEGAINLLKQAQIECVMITGDNTLTGSNISYKCNISDRKKDMLIIDYVNQKFTQENFNFLAESTDDSGGQTTSIVNKQALQIELQTKLNSKPTHLDLIPQSKVANNYQSQEELSQYDGYMNQLSQKVQNQNSQLCVTGRAFNELFKGLITELSSAQRRFMKNSRVFARTKPQDKAKIVLVFQHLGKKVSMCGDGANDCGALKQADIGLSLSQAEASISAPFTSKIANITSMVELIKQCRAGLATNFSLFNIMAIYSLIEYSTTVIDERYLQYPADLQYLYWDLCLNFFFILFIGYTATADHLSIERPKSSLFSFTNLLMIIITFGIQVAGQISIIAIFQKVDHTYYWLKGGMGNAQINFNLNEGFPQDGVESNAIFAFINNLYVATMLGFNIARPWRKFFFTNFPLMIVIFLTLLYNHFLIFWDDASWSVFKLQHLVSMDIRWAIFGASIGFSLVIYLNLKLILEPFTAWLIRTNPDKKWL